MKKLLLTMALIFGVSLHAQTTVSTFSSALSGRFFTEAGSWTGQTSVSAGILTVSGSATGEGYFIEASTPAPFDGAQMLSLSVTARIDSGNADTGFIVSLFDADGIRVASSTFGLTGFNVSSFATVTSLLTATGTGNLNSVVSFGLAGGGTSAAFAFSFDEITANAVPEPSTYVLILSGLALGFISYLRRRTA